MPGQSAVNPHAIKLTGTKCRISRNQSITFASGGIATSFLWRRRPHILFINNKSRTRRNDIHEICGKSRKAMHWRKKPKLYLHVSFVVFGSFVLVVLVLIAQHNLGTRAGLFPVTSSFSDGKLESASADCNNYLIIGGFIFSCNRKWSCNCSERGFAIFPLLITDEET